LGSGDHGHWGGAGNLAVDNALKTRDLLLHKPCPGETHSLLVSLNYVVWFETSGLTLRQAVPMCLGANNKIWSLHVYFRFCFWKKLSEGRLQTVWGCRQILTTVGKNATLFTASNSKGLKRTQHPKIQEWQNDQEGHHWCTTHGWRFLLTIWNVL